MSYHAAFPGDTYFPVFDKEMFIKTVDARVEGEIPYDYITYIRKQDCLEAYARKPLHNIPDNGIKRK